MRINVVSMSGGKDSTATALVCRELEAADSIRYADDAPSACSSSYGLCEAAA